MESSLDFLFEDVSHVQNYKIPSFDTSYVECVYFIYQWRDLQFKVVFANDRFLRNFSCHFDLHSEFLPENRRSPKKYFSYFILLEISDLRFELRFDEPTHYLLDYGEHHRYSLERIIGI